MEKVSYIDASALDQPTRSLFAAQLSAWITTAHSLREPVLPQTPPTLERQFASGLSVLGLMGNAIVAHITAYPLTEINSVRWLEIGTMFVHWDNRRQGIGNRLAEEISQLLPADNLVPTSKNLSAIKAFLAAGYISYPYAQIPPEVRQGLCYTASCFTPNGHPGRCINEHDYNGSCLALIRKP